MQSVYILALVTLCQGLPLETRVAQLTAPSTVRVAILDPPAILVTWNKIFSSDVLDPIVGYKVKVWEVKNIETLKFTDIYDEATLVMEEKEEPTDVISGPHVILTTAEKTTATYQNVKLDVIYEVRVQAFTKNMEGPMSDPIRVKLDKN